MATKNKTTEAMRPRKADKQVSPIESPAASTDKDARLRQAHAALEAAQSELEAFCYSVSHDLRAPLRCIDGFSHALLAEFGPKLDPEARDYVDRIVEAGKKLARLIEELLAVSRIQRADLLREELNLSELANEIVARLQQQNPGRIVRVKIAPRLSAFVDRKLVTTLLTKLLDNAWKFTSKASAPRIEVNQARSDSDKVFFVRDNGVGFEMSHASKLFKAFQRLHADFPGLGAGLALSRAIVRRHGGRIWAESAPNKGATFFFTLAASNVI